MYGNPNATQGFIWNKIAWPLGLLERKNSNNDVICYVYIYYFPRKMTSLIEQLNAA